MDKQKIIKLARTTYLTKLDYLDLKDRTVWFKVIVLPDSGPHLVGHSVSKTTNGSWRTDAQ